MRKVTLLLALLLFAQISFGQEKLSDNKIEISEPYDAIRAKSKEYFVFNDKLISIYGIQERITLRVHDVNSLVLEKSKVFKDFPKKCHPEEIIKIKDKLFLFYSVWDRKREKLFALEINVEECSFIGEAKLVIEENNKLTSTKGLPIRDRIINTFDFSKSDDESKLLIQYRLLHDKNLNDKIGFKVFDENLNMEWEKLLEMPYPRIKIEHIESYIDSKGNVYFGSLIFRDNTTKRINGSKKINYDVELFKVDVGTENISQIKISMEGNRIINNLELIEYGENRIIVTGYYSYGGKDSNSVNKCSGIFKFDFNQLNEKLKIDYYEIPLEIINQYVKEKRIKKDKMKGITPGIVNLEPRGYYMSEDGSLILIGEQYSNSRHGYFIQTPLFTRGGGEMKHYYGNILVTKISKDGSLSWMKKLPKRQMHLSAESSSGTSSFYSLGSGNPGWIEFNGSKKTGKSYRLLEDKNDLYFIYLDNKRNLKISAAEVPACMEYVDESYLLAYRINQVSGEVKKSILVYPREIKGINTAKFDLKNIIFLERDELIIEVNKVNYGGPDKGIPKDVLIKVTWK